MKKLLLAGAAGLLSIASAHALPTSFSTGGLTFSNISCTAGSSGTTAGDCGGLGLAPAAGGNGVQIQGLLSSVSAPASTSGSRLDLIISYQLTSTTPFSSVGLDFNGATFGSGVARAEVVESAYTAPGGALLGQTNVGTPSPLSSTLSLGSSLSSLYLVKDIGLFSFPDQTLTGATISFIDQTFPGGGTGGGPGGPTPAPEPASLAVLGAGLLGCGLLRRRRS